jgi:hypothetical protein
MIQEKSKLVNMNVVPQVGMAFRLDYPNLQIQSEELVDYLDVRNQNKYGLKLKEPEDNFTS